MIKKEPATLDFVKISYVESRYKYSILKSLVHLVQGVFVRYRSLLANLVFSSCFAIQTPYILYLNVHEYPQPELQVNPRPGLIALDPAMLHIKLAEHRHKQPTKVGVIALYNGNIAFSDNDGKIVFPRTTQQDSFSLVITHDIEFIYDIGNTVRELRVPQKEAYAMYSIKRIEDKETGASLWDVEPMELQSTRRIPLHAIIILAKPENIFIPTGVTISNNQPNLQLPTIYAKPGLDHINNALFVMNIKQYLAPIRRLYKKESSGYNELATTTNQPSTATGA